jgi:glycosyltransferase involved in cell wall biosynthesis
LYDQRRNPLLEDEVKIAFIVAGSGDSFYCQNCLRDRELTYALSSAGHEVVTVPLYLPLLLEKEEKKNTDPVFYPAVNLYLKQNYSWAQRLPRFLKKWLDSRGVLKMAASFAGSTRAEGLEDLTISMLRGEAGKQNEELENLCRWLSTEIKPDAIHLANALLLGLASRLKQSCRCPVFCTLQDEHTWMDSMGEKAAHDVWDLMRKKASDVDLFFPVTEYYKKFIGDKLGLHPEKMELLPVSVHHNKPAKTPDKDSWSVGYLSRMEEAGGLEELLYSIESLKKKYPSKTVTLHIDGGFTADDKAFLKRFGFLIRSHGLKKNVVLRKSFDKAGREKFFSDINIMTVPKKEPEALGLYVLESLSCGVPVVLPDFANFTEILGTVGAGLLYPNNVPGALTQALEKALTEPDWIRTAGEKALKYISDKYSPSHCASDLVRIYKKAGVRDGGKN